MEWIVFGIAFVVGFVMTGLISRHPKKKRTAKRLAESGPTPHANSRHMEGMAVDIPAREVHVGPFQRLDRFVREQGATVRMEMDAETPNIMVVIVSWGQRAETGKGVNLWDATNAVLRKLPKPGAETTHIHYYKDRW